MSPQTEFDCQDVIAACGGTAATFFGEECHYTCNTRGAFDIEHM